MSKSKAAEHAANLIHAGEVPAVDVLGPTVRFLTPPGADDNSPCVMLGTIPPDGVIPLHSHADPETFIAISGEVEGLTETEHGFQWVRVKPGDVFHVPGGAKHAWRNRSSEPAVQYLISTARMARFFQEIGTPIGKGAPLNPPSPETLRHFEEITHRYGYWNATPEENAQIGLTLPAAA